MKQVEALNSSSHPSDIARPGFAIAISGLSLGLSGAEALDLLEAGSVQLAVLHSGSMLAVALAFAIWILRPDMQLWPGPAVKPKTSPSFSDDLSLIHI